MKRVDFDQRLHQTYHKGRALSPETLALWMDALAPHVPDLDAPVLLDLGCGTGRFTGGLARRFGAGSVIGVDPSARMLDVAREVAAGPGVSYRQGSGERIPLEDGECHAALLSMVLHHFEDLPAACREIHRVLKPGGRALVRQCFPDRMDWAGFHRFFPSARRIDEDRMPARAEAVEAFRAAGFSPTAEETVRQEIDPSLRAHYERIKQRAISTFELISDEEFDAGLALMAAAADRECAPVPVVEAIDLVVFERE